LFKFHLSFSPLYGQLDSYTKLIVLQPLIYQEAKVFESRCLQRPRNVKVEDVPEPRVSGRKILVKFKAGSICGTDMHFYRGEWKWMKRGRIIGHDACGVRADTGE
jgi:D-arabinose 1-dehydrogenase-like Zn-dependent alcohol dehydrogenase